MPRSAASLEQLFDQTWRPGRPMRPRLSPFRRWGMFCVLCFLLSVIAAYWYLTDAARVQKMCESYLSQLTGGHVEVRRAALSIFEGLRLEGVSVRVDNSGALDSGIFDVQTVLLKYNPESILSGKLEATEIVAIDARVRLCEDLDATSSRWNYERIKIARPPATSQPREQKPMVLPQIKLRNAQVHYSRLQGGKLTPLGTMALDGSLSPGETLGTCLFRMQSRVESGTLGPVVRGEAIPATGEVGAQMENFTFGPGIKSMLPEDVRRFMEDHQLAGKVDVVLHLKPDPRGGKPQFRVEMNLNKVAMAISPKDWLSSVERRQIDTMHGAFDLMRVAGMNGGVEGSGFRVQGSENANTENAVSPPSSLNPESRTLNPSNGFVDHLEGTVSPSLIRLGNVDGKFVFTQDGIEIQWLAGRVERNSFQITGHIDGYDVDAPAQLEVVGEDLYIPHTPRYANAMPRVVRQIYEALHPEGSGRLTVKMVRSEAGKKPVISGELQVEDGQFVVDEFPYPLRNVTGKITFGPDAERGTRLDLVNLRAHGVKWGPNEHNTVIINGLVSPIDGDAEMNINVTGEHILSEPAIRLALPKEGKEALRTLDPSGKGDYPMFKANILANVHRDAGPYKPFTVTLTLDLEDGAGAFEGFSYPLDHVTGRVEIGDGYVNMMHCATKKGDATVDIDGRLTFGKNKPLTPDITITARNAPIDKTLLAAISPDRREWLEKLGVTGKLDVDGKIFLKPGSSTQPVATTQSSEVEVALDMKVHDAASWPRDSTFAVSDLSGKLRLADGRITFTDFKGKRGEATLAASGRVLWAEHRPDLSVTASAKNLLLEPALYQLLPKDAQAGWDSVHPEGTVDVEMQFGDDARKRDGSPSPTTAPSLPYHLALTPNKLAATLKELPYKLTDLSGTIVVTPEGTTIENVMGKHKGASIAISGTGTNGGPEGAHGGWNLKLIGRDVPVDDDLRKALPASLSALLQSMSLRGKLAFDFQKLDYRPGAVRADGKAADGDLDLAGTVWFGGASMELGLPVTDAEGLLKFEAGIRSGKLGGLKGKLEASEMKFAGRPAKDFSTELFKPESQDLMRLDKIQGGLAGGEVAGQVDLAFPDNAASRFAIGLVLRNADVTQLTGEKDIRGQMTASLALEGAWNDPTTRRGRGDVTVAGRDMYHIPLMLGLMQITNLSLPISKPFSEGNARYSVEGQKITFEQIELRASSMIMQGSGSMNFDTKKVKMTFVTDNPNWPKLPLVNDLIQGAKHELLQIHVSGTIEQPKVTGSLMSTFQTTVDEVLRGGGSEKKK
jgi:hypothetical protein